MAIYNGRILMRRGLEEDFDASKLMSGEWALSTDKGIVRICLEAGTVIRMATYEAFEEDMRQIEAILLECQTIEEAVERINAEIDLKAQAVIEYVGQAKTYRDEALQFRNEAEAFKNQAGEIADIGIATSEKAGIVKPDGATTEVLEDGTLRVIGGGGGGTSNYDDLTNKPKINGVELNGNKTTADLGIEEGTTDYTELNNKPKINGVEIMGDLTSDDLNIKAGDNAVYLTQAEYDALPDSKLTDGVEYRITDAGTESITASNVGYDNSASGLEAVTTQQAIDKLNDKTIHFSSVLIGKYTTSATQGETVTITITFPTTKKPTECVFVPCSLVIGILVDEPIIKINENTVAVDIKLYLLNTTSQPRVSGYIIYK